MRRRQVTLAFGAAAVWPFTARAQQAALPVVGFLCSSSSSNYAVPHAAFLKGLADAGYVDGRNVVIEYRWAENRHDRLPALAADLVQRRVAVIAALTTAAAQAAKAATWTIPIVFETGEDPVALGLVQSLNRPGGNATGSLQLYAEVELKGLELFRELLPTAKTVALLVNPDTPALMNSHVRTTLPAGQKLGLQIEVLEARSDTEFGGVFGRVKELHANGLLIGADSLFTGHSQKLGSLAAQYSVPAIYKGREFVSAGGLAAYGSDIRDAYYKAGVYTGRVLKGVQPAELPVEQSTKVELYLNLRTARALGITIPPFLVGRADEVIE